VISAINSIAPAATLLVSIATLAALCVYTWFTHRIMRASIEQSEALQKPCLALAAVPRPWEDSIWELPRVSQIAAPLQIVNIGPGPAIGISYCTTHTNPVPGQRPTLAFRGFLAYLAPREEWNTDVSGGHLADRQIGEGGAHRSSQIPRQNRIRKLKWQSLCDSRGIGRPVGTQFPCLKPAQGPSDAI